MMKKIYFCLFIAASNFAAIAAQTPTPSPNLPNQITVSPTPVQLETILSEAEKQTKNYQETFKNLLATETKTFEDYDKNGILKEESVVESNFFVYQSAKSQDVSSELRNVTKVDGKLIADSQARADRFLAELGKSSTTEKELEKIQNEGSRYDKTLRIDGLTLFEAISLDPNLRPYFEFKLDGMENYQGNDVYVVSYRQTRKSPFISVNEKPSADKKTVVGFDVDLPGALKKNDLLLRGKLLLDKQTFQLRREERQLVVQTTKPMVAVETILEYQPSEFEILVPKRVALQTYTFRKISGDSEFSPVKDLRAVFDYSKFRKFDVDVQILDDK